MARDDYRIRVQQPAAGPPPPAAVAEREALRDAQHTAPVPQAQPVSNELRPSRPAPQKKKDADTGELRGSGGDSANISADESREILSAAAGYGLRPRLHADELAPSGGAELAAEIGATTADHLATPSEAGIAAMALAAEEGHPVVATLLPATTWFLMKDHHAPARTFIERGVPVAIGTDFNPGTSPTASLPLAMTAACLNLRMTPDEVLAAATINAALALGLADEIGSLEAGKQADLVVWNVPTSRQIPYWPAADLVRTVVKRGRIVLDRMLKLPRARTAA